MGSARVWTDLSGSEWHLSDEPADVRVFDVHFQKLLEDEAWRALEGGHFCIGFHGAMDFVPARRLYESMLSDGDFKGAFILRRIVTAGVWTSGRQRS